MAIHPGSDIRNLFKNSSQRYLISLKVLWAVSDFLIRLRQRTSFWHFNLLSKWQEKWSKSTLCSSLTTNASAAVAIHPESASEICSKSPLKVIKSQYNSCVFYHVFLWNYTKALHFAISICGLNGKKNQSESALCRSLTTNASAAVQYTLNQASEICSKNGHKII